MIKNILLIGMGGFVGSIARYFLSTLNLYYSFLGIPIYLIPVLFMFAHALLQVFLFRLDIMGLPQTIHGVSFLCEIP